MRAQPLPRAQSAPYSLRLAFFGLALICLAACGEPGAVPPVDGSAVPPERPSVATEVRPGFIELRRWREPRQRLVIDRGGVSVGPAGGPLVRKVFIEPGRLEDLLYFLRTYAPFRQRSAAGELAFGGQGSVKAGAVERRMIFEWTRKVAAEVEAGQSQDSYGLVLAWQRGGAPGSCDGLVVYLDGEVRASSCVWPDESRGRLRPEPLARLHEGYDAWKPLQQGAGMEAGRGRVPVRLTFAGRGVQAAPPEDIAGLQALAAALHRELAVRRGGGPPPQPVVPGSSETNKEAPAAAPGPSLLVAPAAPARLPPPKAVLPQHIPPPSAGEDGAPMAPAVRRRQSPPASGLPPPDLTPSIPLSRRPPADRERGRSRDRMSGTSTNAFGFAFWAGGPPPLPVEGGGDGRGGLRG